MEYIQNIKRIRKGLGLTQQELAGPGLSRSMISLIESGRSVPSLKTLQLIADKLGVPVKNLVDDDSSNKHEEKTIISDEIIKKRISVCHALLEAKKLNEAEKLLSETAKLTENNVFSRGLVLKEQGAIALEREDFTNAIHSLEEALLYLTPDYMQELIETHCQLAEAYRYTKNYVQAIGNALYGEILTQTKQLKIDPLLQLRLYFNLAYCYSRRKEFSRALDVIDQAIKIMKDTRAALLSGEFYMLKGLSEMYLGNHEAALKSDEAALTLFQENEDEVSHQRIIGCLVNMGIAYRSLRRFHQSYTVLIRSYRMMEKDHSPVSLKNAIFELSLTLCYLEKYDEAQDLIGEGLDLQTNEYSMDGKLNYVAALIYYRQNDLKTAEGIIDKAHILLDSDPYWQGKCLKLKGMILSKKGNSGDAYKTVDEALGSQLEGQNKIYSIDSELIADH